MAADLAARGRGFLDRRVRRVDRIVGEFVGAALNQPPGGVLPKHVRDELREHIDRIINALELHVARTGDQSRRRAVSDAGVVKQIYALREARQQILQTSHFQPLVRA